MKDHPYSENVVHSFNAMEAIGKLYSWRLPIFINE